MVAENDFLIARNVSKTYPGVRALNNINFSLRRGEIHCLVGENGSGKSTLIKIISGVVQPEPNAEVIINNRPIRALNPHLAISQGIRVIYQDLALFPNLTVMENISFQSSSEQKSPMVRWKHVAQVARNALQEIGLEIDLNRQVESLSIAERQLVEITRSLIGNLKLLILDEPTASLTHREVQALFEVIMRLQRSGITVLFISHKLNEVFDLAERVTVLRDGEMIGVYNPEELSQEKLTFLMTGHEVSVQPPPPLESPQPLLRISGLSKKDNYRDINLQLSQGEILGIIGLLGSGRSELARTIFGMNPPDSGTIFLEEQPVSLKSNTEALRHGIGYVPENRLIEGVIMEQSIADNVTITIWNTLTNRFGLIDREAKERATGHWAEKLGIKTSDVDMAMQTLSGGNQQKVVLAKWLATNPKILLLDEPTVGIDIIAKDSIHRLIQSLPREGIGIILISDEIQEVLHNCHRVLIMQHGRIADEFRPSTATKADDTTMLRRYNLA